MSMTSRERLHATLQHQQVDRVCVDFGATAVTGIAASIVSRLRARLLGDPDPAKAQRVMQAMLQMVKLDIAGLEAAHAGR